MTARRIDIDAAGLFVALRDDVTPHSDVASYLGLFT